jgi:hypothetical protein
MIIAERTDLSAAGSWGFSASGDGEEMGMAS